jgi:NDP-sugar pyrophosphorylase family protein
MQALILAGGKGTRLRPYTTVLPKPLMPVCNYPILEIIIRQLKHAGVQEIILAVSYMSHLFQAFFQDGSRYGLKIHYSLEEQALGTAGPIALALDKLEDDFLVMNGDLLTTLNYRKLYSFHKERGGAATIGLFPREVKIDFGVIEKGADQQLKEYTEKPVYHFTVSMGINAFKKNVVRAILEPGKAIDIPDLILRIKDAGLPVYCYSENCQWLDIGRMDDYQQAVEMFESKPEDFLPNME